MPSRPDANNGIEANVSDDNVSRSGIELNGFPSTYAARPRAQSPGLRSVVDQAVPDGGDDRQRQDTAANPDPEACAAHGHQSAHASHHASAHRSMAVSAWLTFKRQRRPGECSSKVQQPRRMA
jgi:hypothetical protein